MRPELLIGKLWFILAVSLALGAESERKAESKAWPMFRGNPAQTGVADSSLPANLRLLWSYETKASIESTAAISEGMVYVGAENARLMALDLASGKLIWDYAAKGPIKASPAVRSGCLFFGDEAGTFHALNAKTGKMLWTFETGGQIIASATCVEEHPPDKIHSQGQPTPPDFSVLVGSYDHFLYAFFAATGKLKWKFETAAQVHASPCVMKETVLTAGCDGFLRILSLADGKELGNLALGSNVAATPAASGDEAFIATFNGAMLCVNVPLRRIVWRIESSKNATAFYASPAVSGRNVIFAGRDGVVRCVDTVEGREKWRFKARGQVDSSPVIVRERVFFGSHDGTLYAVRLSNGEKLWSFAAGSPIVASPAIGENKLVVGNTDGAIYCFGE